MAFTMSEEFSYFATYASAVMVKMVVLSPLTGYMRITRKNIMAFTMSEELSYFATYAAAVMLKMVVLSPLTGYMRFTRKAFANQEDLVGLKDKKPVFDNPIVERIRRCHLNDLENIVPFFGLGLLYAFASGAPLTRIVWHYRVFVISRFLHSFAYLFAVPQPTRALSFAAGLVVNISMGVQIIMNNWNF